MTTYINCLGNTFPRDERSVINSNTSISTVGNTYTVTSSSNITITPNWAGSTDLFQYQSNKFIFLPTNNSLITIDPSGSDTINGQSSIVLGSGDQGIIYTDTVNYFLTTLFLQPANVSAYLNSNQTLPATPTTLIIPYSTENFDIGGFFTTGASANYTPLLPGKYRVSIQSELTVTTAVLTTITLSLYKNGAEIYRSKFSVPTGLVAATVTLAVNPPLIPMNGSTDTLTAVLSQDSAATQTVVGNAAATIFGASRVSLF